MTDEYNESMHEISSWRKKKEKIDFHYTIIASGRDQENILYQISDLDLSECVTFTNGLPHEETVQKLFESDLLLLSSVEEGISNAVLEAMALGVPVISTDCPSGPREILNNGDLGNLVPPADPELLATEILNFLNFPSENLEKALKAENSSLEYLPSRIAQNYSKELS